jgi:hypothetical protein
MGGQHLPRRIGAAHRAASTLNRPNFWLYAAVGLAVVLVLLLVFAAGGPLALSGAGFPE